MKVGVAKESSPEETRVAVVPDTARRLVGDGVEVLVERGAGEEATFSDAAYEQARARVVSGDELYAGADLVCKVRKPSAEEVARLRDGQVLLALLQPLVEPELVQALAQRGVTAFSMDSIPRVTRAQPMDALSSQSTIAGYKAAILAAEQLGKFFPMLTTAAGTSNVRRIDNTPGPLRRRGSRHYNAGVGCVGRLRAFDGVSPDRFFRSARLVLQHWAGFFPVSGRSRRDRTSEIKSDQIGRSRQNATYRIFMTSKIAATQTTTTPDTIAAM